MEISKYSARKYILKKMVRHNLWGGKHTAFDNLSKGVPKHLKHIIKKESKELIKDGFLIRKPTGYGLHVSLNVEKKEEIEKLIFDF